MNEIRNVVVFAAHPDDELLGVGATIKRLSLEGVHAHAVILAEGITSRTEKREDANINELKELQEDCKRAASIIGYESVVFCGLPDNRMDELDLLDIVKMISKYTDDYKPDTIFTHHHGDLNIDHRIVCEAVLTATRPAENNIVKRIYSFETPSSTEWNFNYSEPFCPNVYVDVSNTIDEKIEAMNCYRSEKTIFPHPRSKESLYSLARYRGSNAGMQYSEAFRLLRGLI